VSSDSRPPLQPPGARLRPARQGRTGRPACANAAACPCGWPGRGALFMRACRRRCCAPGHAGQAPATGTLLARRGPAELCAGAGTCCRRARRRARRARPWRLSARRRRRRRARRAHRGRARARRRAAADLPAAARSAAARAPTRREAPKAPRAGGGPCLSARPPARPLAARAAAARAAAPTAAAQSPAVAPWGAAPTPADRGRAVLPRGPRARAAAPPLDPSPGRRQRPASGAAAALPRWLVPSARLRRWMPSCPSPAPAPA